MTVEPLALDILVVCRANECRSPATAAVLHRELSARGIAAKVRSAGIRAQVGHPADPVMAELLSRRGLDLTRHASQQADHATATGVSLVITASRAHLRVLVADLGASFNRSFTLRELARRAERVPPRQPNEALDDWLMRLGEGRSPGDLLGRDAADDLADPTGREQRDYVECLAQIERSVGVICERGRFGPS